MFVLMVPGETKDKDLSLFPPINDIKICKLLSYDESLSELLKRSKKLFFDILNYRQNLLTTKDGITVDSSSGPAEFAWDSEEYPPESLDSLIDHFNKNLENFLNYFVGIKEELSGKPETHSQPQPADTLQREQETKHGSAESTNHKLQENFLDDSISYIDSLYCMVRKPEDKSFKRTVNQDSLEVVRQDSGHILYKIYCLKAESDRLLGILSRSYKCSRSLVLDESNNAIGSRYSDGLASLHSLAKNGIRKLVVHIFLLKACIESLHSIGLPQNYKFKVVDRVKREMRKISKNNHGILVPAESDSIPYVAVEIDKEIVKNLFER